MLAGLMKAPTKLAPNHNPPARDRARQPGHRRDGAGGLHHRGDGQGRARPSGPCRARARTRGSVNYAADYVMDVLDDTIGAIDEDIVVTHDHRSGHAGGGRTGADRRARQAGRQISASRRARWCRSTRPARSAPWSAAAITRTASSIAPSPPSRQPGSAFKPFVYLDRARTWPDARYACARTAPINVRGWQPENSSHKYFGPVNLTTALALSLNTVAVRLGLEVGPRAVIQTAHRLGIASELQPNASIALGTSEVTPLELVTAYVPFANGGIGVQPHIITKVRTADGKLLYARKGSSNGRVIDPHYVAMMNAMLEQTLLDRHREARPTCRAGRRRARPAPARITATPGSSATPASSSPASGSAMTIIRRPKRPRAPICRWKSGAATCATRSRAWWWRDCPAAAGAARACLGGAAASLWPRPARRARRRGDAPSGHQQSFGAHRRRTRGRGRRRRHAARRYSRPGRAVGAARRRLTIAIFSSNCSADCN